MKLIKRISLVWSIMIGATVFAGFATSEGDLVPAKKSSRNMIMGSVQNNKASSVVAPSFVLPDEPKMMSAPMPLSTATPAKGLLRPVSASAPSVTEPTVTEPKNPLPEKPLPKNIFPVVDHLPKLMSDQPEADDQGIDAPKELTVQPAEEEAMPTVPVEISKVEELPVEPGVLHQSKGYVSDEPATIAFNFEDASLSNLLTYIEVVHNIKFITEDIVVGAKDAKGAVVPTTGVAGHKISFRTNRNLTRKESWDLFLTFMHIAGLDVIPMSSDRFYRVVPLTKANTEPVPTYIGVDPNVLPDSDMIVRYVYFTRNVDPSKLQPILRTMQGASAKLDVYAELKGLIFTDRACSIKSLMQIVTELDKAALPEVVSVVKLKRANVGDVKKLLEALRPQNSAGAAQPQKVWVQSKKESTLDYFPSDVTLVGDNRTNSLIILGAARDVQRIEEFVSKYIDMAIDRSSPPIFTYRLQYTNASDIAGVLNKIVIYGASTPAGAVGGVRDGIKFFQKMNIVHDSFTNSLIINATQEDYEALVPLIKDLDTPQKQVGIEVLIVQVTDADVKTLGSQISGPNGVNSPVPGAGVYGPTFGQAMSAQTSGIPQGTPIVVTTGQVGQDDFSLKSSLASLLGNPVLNEVGSVLVTFGSPIWAIFKVLKTLTSTHLIANPFLVVTNNSTASIVSGQERRQVSGEVISTSSIVTKGVAPIQANLIVNITPQVNKGNIINLKISVENSVFTTPDASSAGNPDNSPRDTKIINTFASVGNGETLVLGGIMSESYTSQGAGVPFLEHIPIVGWFFKSKSRTINRSHFMIFVCPRLLDPFGENGHVDHYTNYKLKGVEEHLDLIDQADWFAEKDPVQKAFFGSNSSLALQQFHTGTTYEDRESLDGKIHNPKKARKLRKKQSVKKQPKKNMNSQTPQTSYHPETNKKNAISRSILTTSEGR